MNMLEGPTPTQLKAIMTELAEDTNRLQNNIQLLQNWISCQPHLPQDFDGNLLPVFLRGCKHNLERTKRKIGMYFVARTSIPELFLDRNPNEEVIQNATRMIKLAPLPKLTPDGNRVTIYKITCLGNTDWDMKEILRYIFMTADIRVAEESPIAGDVFIYDLKHLKAGHILKYVTPILKKALISAQEAYPQRLKQIHFINSPSYVDKVLNVTKAFLNVKMRKRFIVHQNLSDLLHYIPREILPNEYSGTAGKYDDMVDSWSRCIIKHKKWFQQQDHIKATSYTHDNVSHSVYLDMVGIDGSFRMLEID